MINILIGVAIAAGGYLIGYQVGYWKVVRLNVTFDAEHSREIIAEYRKALEDIKKEMGKLDE